MVHLEVEWPSQQNIIIFVIFQYFLFPLADTISAEPSPESLQLEGFMFMHGARHSKNLYLIHTTAFAISAN